MNTLIANGEVDAAFNVIDLGTVTRQVEQFRRLLPTVQLHYAIKTNPDPQILRLVSALGCGLDCASKGEMELALNGLGNYCFKPEQIVYSHALKMDAHIQFADQNGLSLTVVDCEEELQKLSRLGSKMDVLIRIAIADHNALCSFTKKFGAKP